MSHTAIVHDSPSLRNYLAQYRLGLYYSTPVLRHIETYMAAATAKGFRGKLVDLAETGSCDRTTYGHFLTHAKWDESFLQTFVQSGSLHHVHQIAEQTGEPLFVITDDSVAEKTKPSSQAKSPIAKCSLHRSNLKRKTVWGHQVQATVLACGDTTVLHTIERHDPTRTREDGDVYSKIDRICNRAATLPIPPGKGYALNDAWYTCAPVIDAFAARGYHLIGGLQTNRVFYPGGVHTSIQAFSEHVKKEDVHLVTVGDSSYWVYRYEGSLKKVANAVVLLCWPEEEFGQPASLRAFLCTDVSLDTETILFYYSKRWRIEVFFRESKGYLGMDTYQVRSEKAFTRLWVLMAWTHLYCTIGQGRPYLFAEGRKIARKQTQRERVEKIYKWAQEGVPISHVLKSLKLA